MQHVALQLCTPPPPLSDNCPQAMPIPPFAWMAFSTTSGAIDAGSSYFNVHSVAFPGGEIRGQIPAFPTPTTSGAESLLQVSLIYSMQKRPA
jgi:hypothetical protein